MIFTKDTSTFVNIIINRWHNFRNYILNLDCMFLYDRYLITFGDRLCIFDAWNIYCTWVWNGLYRFWLRCVYIDSLRWRHNEPDGVSNHLRINCLLNRLFRLRSKKTSMLRLAGLCKVNSPVTGEFPAPRASNAENVSIWWRHNVFWQSSRMLNLHQT